MTRFFPLLSLCLAFLLAAPPAGAQTILHVDRSAAAAGDGSSWASPLTSLADALAQATAGDVVRVDQDTYSTAGGFAIPAGVTVRGSFTANTAQPTERDLSPGQKTVLSGDVDGNGTGDGRVVTVQNAADASVPTTLDGFILTKGAGAGIGDEAGGTALRTQGAGASVVSRVEVLANTSGFSVLQITGQTDVLSSVVANNTSDGPPVVAREWSGTMDRVTAADNAGPTDVRGVNSASGTIQNSLFDGENRIDTRTETPITIDGVTHEIGGDLFAGGYDGQLSRLEIDDGGTTYTVTLGSNPTQNAFSQSILPVGVTVAFRLYDSQGTQVGEASADPEFERPVSAHDNPLGLTDQDEMPERPYHQSFDGVVTMPVADAQALEQLRVLPYEFPINTFNGETWNWDQGDFRDEVNGTAIGKIGLTGWTTQQGPNGTLDEIKLYIPTTYTDDAETSVPSNVHADAVQRTTDLANRFPVPVDIESSMTLNEAVADANNNRNLYNVLVSGVKTQGIPGNNSNLEVGTIYFGNATYTSGDLGRIPSELSSAFGNIDGQAYAGFSPNMREHMFRVQFSYQLNEEQLDENGNEDFVEFVSPLQP